jgi:hypothetical protein
MTRKSLNRTLRRVYSLLFFVLTLSLVAKLGDYIPGMKSSPLDGVLKDVYDYMKDMALVFVTVIAAYLANVFQKRSKFVESLEEEWRGIVRTKSALFTYCEKTFPTADDYIAAFCRISETIDNMRIVYRNVGETKKLVGLYPYEPLHDMRRALQTLDPRTNANITADAQTLARDEILQSFSALRENFLEELDLEAPSHPLLVVNGRRLKSSGATSGGLARQHRQQKRQDKSVVTRSDAGSLPLVERASDKR